MLTPGAGCSGAGSWAGGRGVGVAAGPGLPWVFRPHAERSHRSQAPPRALRAATAYLRGVAGRTLRAGGRPRRGAGVAAASGEAGGSTVQGRTGWGRGRHLPGGPPLHARPPKHGSQPGQAAGRRGSVQCSCSGLRWPLQPAPVSALARHLPALVAGRRLVSVLTPLLCLCPAHVARGHERLASGAAGPGGGECSLCHLPCVAPGERLPLSQPQPLHL